MAGVGEGCGGGGVCWSKVAGLETAYIECANINLTTVPIIFVQYYIIVGGGGVRWSRYSRAALQIGPQR